MNDILCFSASSDDALLSPTNTPKAENTGVSSTNDKNETEVNETPPHQNKVGKMFTGRIAHMRQYIPQLKINDFSGKIFKCFQYILNVSKCYTLLCVWQGYNYPLAVSFTYRVGLPDLWASPRVPGFYESISGYRNSLAGDIVWKLY